MIKYDSDGSKIISPNFNTTGKRERVNSNSALDSTAPKKKRVKTANSVSDANSTVLEDFDMEGVDISFDPTLPRCHVCDTSKLTIGNSLLICNRCGVHVHQCCYGVIEIPNTENWYCRPCLSLQALITSGLAAVSSLKSPHTTENIDKKNSQSQQFPQCALCPSIGKY